MVALNWHDNPLSPILSTTVICWRLYIFIYLSIHIKEHSLQNNTVKKDKTNVRIEWPTQGRASNVQPKTLLNIQM